MPDELTLVTTNPECVCGHTYIDHLRTEYEGGYSQGCNQGCVDCHRFLAMKPKKETHA